VTDVEMPVMDGLALTRRIRADGRLPHLPVLMLTSLAEEEDVRRGREAGATAYAIKLDRDQLLATVGELLAGAPPDASELMELSKHVLEPEFAPRAQGERK
jgi:CheY-like chemotaxis protein